MHTSFVTVPGMLHTKKFGPLHHFRRVSRQGLRAVARVASRPVNSAHDARHADPQALKEHAQRYIDKYATPVAKSRHQLYGAEEGVFNELVITPDLDKRLGCGDEDLQQACHAVEAAVAAAIQHCYGGEPIDKPRGAVDAKGRAPAANASTVSSSGGTHHSTQREPLSGAMEVAASAHTFLQRVLYKINRLNHFWYDDLSNYVNERSPWLARLQQVIEEPWQEWELQQLLASPDVSAGLSGGCLEGYRALSIPQLKQALNTRYAADVDPPLSAAQQYVAADMDALGYCHLLAVGSVDGLVEASRQSRVCAGAANPVSCTIFRVLMEEYGTGRYSRKHSTFYKTMMEEVGLDTREEAYLDLLPWQWLAASNQNFLITERRRHYLRYAGALTFFEINGPSVYKTYLAASRRNGLSDGASGYWELHIKEDERHGRQMLEEVALPLVDRYPADSWELLLGYDQDRFMGTRAGAALVHDLKAAAALCRGSEQQ